AVDYGARARARRRGWPGKLERARLPALLGDVLGAQGGRVALAGSRWPEQPRDAAALRRGQRDRQRGDGVAANETATDKWSSSALPRSYQRDSCPALWAGSRFATACHTSPTPIIPTPTSQMSTSTQKARNRQAASPTQAIHFGYRRSLLPS